MKEKWIEIIVCAVLCTVVATVIYYDEQSSRQDLEVRVLSKTSLPRNHPTNPPSPYGLWVDAAGDRHLIHVTKETFDAAKAGDILTVRVRRQGVRLVELTLREY